MSDPKFYIISAVVTLAGFVGLWAWVDQMPDRADPTPTNRQLLEQIIERLDQLEREPSMMPISVGPDGRPLMEGARHR